VDPALRETLGWLAAALLVLGVVLGLRRWGRLLRERLERLAARRGGRFVAGAWHMAPRVEWSLGDGLLQVSVYTESDEHDGRSCFCSAAHAVGARIPDFELELRRAERLRGDWQVPRTRDAAFARAFRLRTDDEARAHALLDEDLRRELLAFDPALDVALRLGTTNAYRDGVRHRSRREPRLELSLRGCPADVAVLERLLATARRAYAQLQPRPARRAG
jgi:hypothetical protein